MKEDEIKIRINAEIKEKFKLLCQKDNISMSNKIQNFIIDEINKKQIINLNEIMKTSLEILTQGNGSFNIISSSNVLINNNRLFTETYNMNLIEFINKYKNKAIYFNINSSDILSNKLNAIVI